MAVTGVATPVGKGEPSSEADVPVAVMVTLLEYRERWRFVGLTAA
jgi:hypothetical protein